MKKRLLTRGSKNPILIAGPCSAETEEQLMKAAVDLAKDKRITMLRAGIWKPRTRPGKFEGVGEVGLDWLIKAKSKTGLPVTVEVANTEHVEKSLHAGIDVLWIGARTTVNPFAVQEIAEALRGVDIPVLVKNPINPDLGLWIGAVERLQQCGVTEIGAIHRGFSNSSEKVYRNRPQWQIPIEFKEKLPDIPMIVDPSHICGNRTMLADVTQKALNLDYDGVMIESHPTPNEAWSDAQQQITPSALSLLLDDIVLPIHNGEIANSELVKLRNEIDLVDEELFNLISNRMMISREIGDYKRKNNMMILQPNRWKDILKKYKERGENYHLSHSFVKKLIRAIHDESIDQQDKVIRQ